MEKISRIPRTITSILQKISNVIVTNDFKSCKKHLQRANSCKKQVARGQRICFEDNLFFENTHLEQNFVSDIPSSICSKFDSYRPETLRQDFYIPKKENYL